MAQGGAVRCALFHAHDPRDAPQLAAMSFPTARLPAVWHRMPARVYCAAIVPDTPIVVSSCINHSRVLCLVLFTSPKPTP